MKVKNYFVKAFQEIVHQHFLKNLLLREELGHIDSTNKVESTILWDSIFPKLIFKRAMLSTFRQISASTPSFENKSFQMQNYQVIFNLNFIL
jgi:hypothetical protein